MPHSKQGVAQVSPLESSNAEDLLTEVRDPRDYTIINPKEPSMAFLASEDELMNVYNSLGANRLKMMRSDIGYTLPSRFKYQIPVMNNQGMYWDLLRHNRELYDPNNGALIQQPAHYFEGPVLSRESSMLGKRKPSVVIVLDK